MLLMKFVDELQKKRGEKHGGKYKERYEGYTGEKRRTVKSFRVSTYAEEEFEKSG